MTPTPKPARADLAPEALAKWAAERLGNSKRIAATKSGADRDGWLEDVAYWEAICAALARRPAGLRALKDRIDNRLNNRLVYMKEGWDDSIVGFNDAWDIVRTAFAEAIADEIKGDR